MEYPNMSNIYRSFWSFHIDLVAGKRWFWHLVQIRRCFWTNFSFTISYVKHVQICHCLSGPKVRFVLYPEPGRYVSATNGVIFLKHNFICVTFVWKFPDLIPGLGERPCRSRHRRRRSARCRTSLVRVPERSTHLPIHTKRPSGLSSRGVSRRGHHTVVHRRHRSVQWSLKCKYWCPWQPCIRITIIIRTSFTMKCEHCVYVFCSFCA